MCPPLEQAYTVIHSHHLALNLNAGVIAGLGGTVLVVALVLLSLAVWRRYCSEAYYYLEETHSQHGGATVAAAAAAAAATPDWDIRSAVPAHLYVQHVQRLLQAGSSPTRGSCPLAKEFDELNLKCSEKQLPSLIAAQPANMDKNRYNNVLPCKYRIHSDRYVHMKQNVVPLIERRVWRFSLAQLRCC
jgi:hypothetical protein